jgi:sensor histidine kinase regulating citrate/malate metabolism
MCAGAGANRTVWVEPYAFAASSDIGTTCSTPVYDDTGALIGVVGIDFTLETFTQYGSTSQQVLDRLIDRSR